MKILTLPFIMIIASVALQYTVGLEKASAGALGKSLSKAIARKTAEKRVTHQAYRLRVLKRDALRDKASLARPMKKNQYVRRYTSQEQARKEQLHGIKPKTHMTSRIPAGRPISAQTAKKRYGLKERPEVRMKILVPKGHPVKKNKVIGGKPGYGETTSTKRIPGNKIVEIKKLH